MGSPFALAVTRLAGPIARFAQRFPSIEIEMILGLPEEAQPGIDALAEAYDTGEPQARIEAFFAAKAKT